ncbi:MAG: alpha-ribazole phosphatase [Nitrospirota bacterium]
MVKKIYLIRHGETEGAETKRYKGHIDVPLSANGIEQIKRVAGYLVKTGSLDALYCSDLSRAVKSAEIIAEAHGLKPIIMPELRERNFGLWEGMSFDEIREKWPDAFNAWAANPLEFSPINGENTVDVRDRAVKIFNEIIEKHKGDNIAIVSHGGINRVILCHLLGIPLENIFRVEQDYGCLNIIEMWDYPVVKNINFIV